MTEPPVQRRLAAVLAADVADYSRLMGVDEEGTLARLTQHRHELVDPKISQHRGRIVKTTGDGMLVEYASVVDAIRCAVDVQRIMKERNADVEEERRIRYRVGITVGDIIIQDGDIFGDAVNIAARLESLAQPGGICASEDAFRQVHGKLDVAFEDAGEQRLKNIAIPVRVYHVRSGQASTLERPSRGLLDKTVAIGLPSDARPARTQAPMHMGAYTRAAVDHYIGAYITLRVDFQDTGVVIAYRTDIDWDPMKAALTFKESGRNDPAYAHSGYLYVPASSSFVHFVSLTKGAMRSVLAWQIDQTSCLRGLMTTLSKSGPALRPISTPIVYLKREAITGNDLGRIASDHPAYASYRQRLREAVDRSYVKLTQIE